MADTKSGDLKAFYVVLGATAVIAVVALGWSALGGGLRSAATQPIVSIVEGELEDLETLVEMATGVERGDPNAPITILEFGDFQCPACQQFATFVKPQLDLAYVDAGIAPIRLPRLPACVGTPTCLPRGSGSALRARSGRAVFLALPRSALLAPVDVVVQPGPADERLRGLCGYDRSRHE